MQRTHIARLASIAVVLAALFSLAPSARADWPTADPASPFARKFSVGGYGVGWAGSYLAGGVGWRMRWDALPFLGVEVFGESLLVEHQGGMRHDHPVGFDLILPVRFAPWVQMRVLAGFCAVFSFIEPPAEGGPRSDDVLFGAHAGLGFEFALASWVSLFADVQAIAYFGHGRYSQNWGSSVTDDLTTWGSVQGAVGTAFHFDL